MLARLRNRKRLSLEEKYELRETIGKYVLLSGPVRGSNTASYAKQTQHPFNQYQNRIIQGILKTGMSEMEGVKGGMNQRWGGEDPGLREELFF